MVKSLLLMVMLGLGCVLAVPGQTVDELIGRYVKAVGGMDRLMAVKSLRQVGRFQGGGGFTAEITQENKRPSMVREEFALQGMAQVVAYDGKVGWMIDPFGGKKDAEALGEEGLQQIVEDSDFDGPLINYKEKGNKVELIGKEDYEGSDVYKIKVTLANGTVKHYFLDTDYYVPIKVETKRTVRGTETETETILGDYKESGGIFFPFSVESGRKGSTNRGVVTYTKIEINPTLDDSRFNMPKPPVKTN